MAGEQVKEFKHELSQSQRTCTLCKAKIPANTESIKVIATHWPYPMQSTCCRFCFIEKYKTSIVNSLSYKINQYENDWYRDKPMNQSVTEKLLQLKGAKAYLEEKF
jgi:hypothetical protein